jgi:hypothetical protein
LNLAVYRAEDPVIGRWDSQDPLRFAAGDANIYRYVGNDPTNATDPSGMRDEEPVQGMTPDHNRPQRPTPTPPPSPTIPPAAAPIRKNPDGSDKEPGQQYEEIEKRRRVRPPGYRITIDKSKQGDKQELQDQADEYLRNRNNRIVGCVASVGAGYIIYRCVRMLPSLAPPLWWTAGPNLAIP